MFQPEHIHYYTILNQVEKYARKLISIYVALNELTGSMDALLLSCISPENESNFHFRVSMLCTVAIIPIEPSV